MRVVDLLFVAAFFLVNTSSLHAQRVGGALSHPQLAPLAAFRIEPGVTLAAASFEERSRSRALISGVIIGAASGAALGALWGKHTDDQQVCPLGGPCGRRSNVGPYAVTGAGVGALLGAAVGVLRRERRAR